METVAIIWFWSMLFGAVSLISVGEKQKFDNTAASHNVVTVKEAGSEVWKGDESSSVKVYWDTK